MSDDIERPHPHRNCVFGHVLCHSVHMRDDGRGRLRRDEPVTFSGYYVCVRRWLLYRTCMGHDKR